MSKTILITGASSGFGRDTAETLFRAGHTVYASMRGTQGKNREAAEVLRKLGIMTVELDVSDDASVEAGVKKVLVEVGKIDVLVNNAGIVSAGVTEAFTAEQAKVIFDTNVIGLLRVTRAVLPSMRQKRDGLIINIGSVLGRVTFPFLGIYGASKMAVEALTDSLRYEVSQLGVEVVEVQPSAYPTNLFASVSDARRHRSHEVLRRGRPNPRRHVQELHIDLRGQGRPESARYRGGRRQARGSVQGQPRYPHRRRRGVWFRQGQRGRRACPGEGGRGPGPQPSRKNRLMNRLPVFAFIATGMLAARLKLLGRDATDVLNGFGVYLALPALGLFLAERSVGFEPIVIGRLVALKLVLRPAVTGLLVCSVTELHQSGRRRRC